jgi:glutathione synthase
LPTKFPKKQFDFAKEIQPYVGELVHDISNDYNFLRESLGDVITADEFTRNLWNIYETVRTEGIAQVCLS